MYVCTYMSVYICMYVYYIRILHTYICNVYYIHMYRATKSGRASLQPLVDLSPSIHSYITTQLEAGTEYQFKLMAFVNNMLQEASDVVTVTTEPTGKYLRTYL